jgi:hypothetical protein
MTAPLIWLSRRLKSAIQAHYPEKFSTAFWALNDTYPETMFFFDRTGTIDPGFAMKDISPIPERMEGFDEPFSSIMDKTAQQLLAEETHMDVFWSGGIDSTAVLVALLKNCSNEQKELIRVVYTAESIQEYPEFFSEYIEGNLDLKPMEERSTIKALDFNRLIITGVVAEQILGADSYTGFVVVTGGEIADFPITNGYKPYEESAFFWHRNRTDILDLAQPILEKCPFEVKNGFEFIWWLNFVGKWQDACMLIHAGSDCSKAESEMVRNFFQTDDFQQWAMVPENHALRIGETYGTYKQLLKEYIYDFNGDKEYLRHKTKFGSLDPIHEYRPPILGITEDYERIPLGGRYVP